MHVCKPPVTTGSEGDGRLARIPWKETLNTRPQNDHVFPIYVYIHYKNPNNQSLMEISLISGSKSSSISKLSLTYFYLFKIMHIFFCTCINHLNLN